MKALKRVAGMALVAGFLFGSGLGVPWLGMPATLTIALGGSYLGICLLGCPGPAETGRAREAEQG